MECEEDLPCSKDLEVVVLAIEVWSLINPFHNPIASFNFY
jgi:hypothetical protein